MTKVLEVAWCARINLFCISSIIGKFGSGVIPKGLNMNRPGFYSGFVFFVSVTTLTGLNRFFS
jgi:hypothetical protein